MRSSRRCILGILMGIMREGGMMVVWDRCSTRWGLRPRSLDNLALVLTRRHQHVASAEQTSGKDYTINAITRHLTLPMADCLPSTTKTRLLSPNFVTQQL